MVCALEEMGCSVGGTGGEIAPSIGNANTVAIGQHQSGTHVGHRACGNGEIGAVLVEGVSGGAGDILVEIIHIGKTRSHVKRECIQLNMCIEQPAAETIFHTAFDVEPSKVAEGGTGIT